MERTEGPVIRTVDGGLVPGSTERDPDLVAVSVENVEEADPVRHGKAGLVDVNLHFIGTSLHPVSNILLRCNIKRCKPLGRSQRISLRTLRKLRYRLLVQRLHDKLGGFMWGIFLLGLRRMR